LRDELFSRQIKAVIFDFDGTLYGDQKLWTRLIQETLAESSIKVTTQQAFEKARSMIADGTFTNISGITIALAQDQGLQGHDMDLRNRFLQKLDLVMDATGPGDGLVRLLSHLQDKDIQMGIVTFQRLPRLQRRLEIWKLKKYFRSIVTPDQIAEFKPSPRPFTHAIGELGAEAGEALVIGDEPVDMIGAKKAGALAIGLPNGFFSGKELAQAGADHLMNSLTDLYTLLLQTQVTLREQKAVHRMRGKDNTG
jgi:HAD superfamily hydrolase (TIGR01549 family)